VSVRSGWVPEFLQRLRHVDRDTSAAVDYWTDAPARAAGTIDVAAIRAVIC
jgi:hypothetical protein